MTSQTRAREQQAREKVLEAVAWLAHHWGNQEGDPVKSWAKVQRALTAYRRAILAAPPEPGQ